MQPTDESNTIRLERLYPHAIEQVWSAISSEAEISKWFIQADFKPLVGYPYTFTHDGTVITGTVLEATTPRVLSTHGGWGKCRP